MRLLFVHETAFFSFFVQDCFLCMGLHISLFFFSFLYARLLFFLSLSFFVQDCFLCMKLLFFSLFFFLRFIESNWQRLRVTRLCDFFFKVLFLLRICYGRCNKWSLLFPDKKYWFREENVCIFIFVYSFIYHVFFPSLSALWLSTKSSDLSFSFPSKSICILTCLSLSLLSIFHLRATFPRYMLHVHVLTARFSVLTGPRPRPPQWEKDLED